jgi:hypothetical protein
MASNFHIFSYKTRDSLHLKLSGDFDGSSAHELINALIEHSTGFHQIFIDTNDLKTIHQFGRDVFQKKLGSFNKQFRNFIFIGKMDIKLQQIRSNCADHFGEFAATYSNHDII